MPKLRIEKANNGTNLIVCKVKNALASVRCVVNAGAKHEIEEKGEYGVAHFLEHMFFKGTHSKGYEEINKILGRIGEPNAYTANNKTVYHVSTLPTMDKISAGLEILAEMVYESSIPEDELEKEKGTIVQEWQSGQDNPFNYFFDNISTSVAGPLAHPTIGTKDSIENMTRDNLIGFRKRTYNPNNMAFCIVGDVDEDAAMDMLHKAIDDRENIAEEGNFERISGKSFGVERMNVNHSSEQAIVSLWYPWHDHQTVREMNYIPCITMNAIGGGMHSLIFDRIREKLGLAYSTGCFVNSTADVYHAVCYGLCDASKASLVEEEIRKIMGEVLDSGIDDELFDIAWSNDQFDTISSMQTIQSMSRVSVDSYFYKREYMGDEFDDAQSFIERYNRAKKEDVIKCLEILRDQKPMVLTQNVGE